MCYTIISVLFDKIGFVVTNSYATVGGPTGTGGLRGSATPAAPAAPGKPSPPPPADEKKQAPPLQPSGDCMPGVN